MDGRSQLSPQLQEQLSPPSRERPKYPLGSVESGLRLILYLAARPEARLTDAAAELGLSRSTTHRLLRMLEFYGFASQDPSTRTYRVGPLLTSGALPFVGDFDVAGLAHPLVEELVERIRETVHLVTLRGDGRVLCLASIESPKEVRVGLRTGHVMPGHGTAGGLALLADLPAATLNSLFTKEALPRFTEDSLHTRAELTRELEEVRRRGYAVSRGLHVKEISGIGVAVPDPLMHVAVAIATPSSRFTDELEYSHAVEARRTAELIASSFSSKRLSLGTDLADLGQFARNTDQTVSSSQADDHEVGRRAPDGDSPG